jgi:hypothetical protein
VVLKFSCWKPEQEACRVSFKDFLFFYKISKFFWAWNSRPYWQAVGEDPKSSPIAESRQEFHLHGTWFEPRTFSGFCDSQSDDHSQNNLAKFDNILDMKVEENRTVLYFDYQPGTCHTNLAIWKKKIQCLPNLGPFSHEKSLV